MSRRPLVLICVPLICLALSPLFGIGLAIRSVLHTQPSWLPQMQVLQPLHTLASVGCILTGICALFVLTSDTLGARGAVFVRRTVSMLLVLFLPLAAGSILMGAGSGKEYLTWAPVLTPILILVFLVLGASFVVNIDAFTRLSPEGTWLIGVGLVCIPLGLIEASSYLLPAVAFDRELSFEWHGLDIVFAGWNALLYGFGILIAGGKGKPLRAPWLFILAAFGFASTFGHHHYFSPQPQVIKIIAVIASMLAALSFVKHMRAAVRFNATASSNGPVTPFLRAAELWTLVAFASGILLAIPQINLVLHGTTAIVAHTMGAMIGVNIMLVLGGLTFYLRESIDEACARRLKRYVTWIHIALVLIWLDLATAGTIKGLLRFEHSYASYHLQVTRAMYPLLILGPVLAVPLLLMCWEIFRIAIVEPSRANQAGQVDN